MKARIVYHSLLATLAVAVVGTFTSCEDADADVIDNGVYIAEAASKAATKIAVEEEGAKIAFTVRLAQPTTQDVHVKVSVDPSILKGYNELNKTNFETLPTDYWWFESTDDNSEKKTFAEAVIKAGDIAAPQTVINVQTFTTGGKNFALPVVIEQVEGPVAKTNTSSKFIYQLDKPLIVKTPILTGANKGVVAGPFDSDNAPIKWGVTTLTWTLEGWVRMDGFDKNNQALFNSGSGDHEIYIRFGDVTNYSDKWWIKYMPYLQIKTLGSQVETGPVFKPNTWAHFALTYDGTNCTIYMNGEQKAQFAPPSPKGGMVRFDQMQMISSGSSWFINKCNLSQVRLWKVALTQLQIQNNMYYELDASNPDMMAYWKMDEGEGNQFADATGNGHDAVAETNCLRGWTDYLRFDK